jgi:hypothetical protein
MTTRAILLLMYLQLAHYMGDFTPLLVKNIMLDAKRYGTPILPILCHGVMNGVTYGLGVLLIYWNIKFWILTILIETITHTILDTMKGWITFLNYKFEDKSNNCYWILFGADQLGHQLVIIWILALVS